MNQADVSKLISALRIPVLPRKRLLRTPEGPYGRLKNLRKIVTALFKYERIELNYNSLDEARGYAERLISEAVRHGDKHHGTMELADFWLEEKQLVHKLFKVLVPRYQNFNTSYTQMYKAPRTFPGNPLPRSVLELKGHPYPPLVIDHISNRNWIQNVLLTEAQREYRMQKIKETLNKDETQSESPTQ